MGVQTEEASHLAISEQLLLNTECTVANRSNAIEHLQYIFRSLFELRRAVATQRNAHRRFLDQLHRRKKQQQTALDIRAHIVSMVSEPISFGFNDFELDTYSYNLKSLFSQARSNEESDWKTGAHFFVLGCIYDKIEISDQGATNTFRCPVVHDEVIFMEQCFLATAGSWAECFNERNRNYACLGYFYDDLAHYYMAEFPNRLIEKLNSEEELAVDQRTRASQLIGKLVNKKISKYNSQPIEPIEFNPKFSRRVLVCDQTFPDASVQYGLAGEDNFDAMLEAAIVENPDAEIIVKASPRYALGQ